MNAISRAKDLMILFVSFSITADLISLSIDFLVETVARSLKSAMDGIIN